MQLAGLFSDADNTSQPTELSIHSRAMFKAAIILAQQYNITINGHYVGWQTVQTSDEFITALSDLCSFIPTQTIIGIIGHLV